jgi:RNA polymerase sigma-70 factor (ECF subfamily)
LKLDHRGGEPENRVGGLAFDVLVEQQWESVYRLTYHLCGNVHDAQDLAQETFLKAIGARGSFREGTNLRAWLARIASNAFLDMRRRRKTAKAAPLEVEVPVELPDAAQGGEIRELVAAAIGRLDDTQRAVFLLRTQEDLSFREIAETLGTTEETARWHMMQARRKLMKQLDGKV